MEDNSHFLYFPFLLFSLFSPAFFRSFFILSRSVPFRFRNFAPVPAIYWFETVVPCLDRLKPEQWNGDGCSRSDTAIPAKNRRSGEPSHPFAIPAKTMAIKAISALVFVAMMATSIVAASIVAAQNRNGMVQVNGTLYCSSFDSRGGGADAAPVFPDAVVQVWCPANVISNSPITTTNNSDGAYVLPLTPQPSATIESIITNCRIFVRTPLSSCNAELASPRLISNLQSLKTVPGGSSVITYMVSIHHQHDYCRFFAPRLAARLGHQLIVWICLMLE